MMKERNTKKAVQLVLISLALILFGALFASLIQSDWGNIQVTNLKIPYYNGQYVSADLFKPKAATADNPAPMVIVIAGSNRTKETQVSTVIELARRGFVVLSLDPNSTGDTSITYASDGSNGLYSAVEYVVNTNIFNYVDKTRIGITGHSAGGNAALKVATYYSNLETDALASAESPESLGGTKVTDEEKAQAASLNLIRSCFDSGYLRKYTEKTFAPLRCNFALGYAFYDEGGYRNINKDGDLRYAPESIAMINSTLEEGEKVSEVEIGKWYGDAEDNSLRICYNEKCLHPLQSYSRKAIEAIVEFFEYSMDYDSGIEASKAVWGWKEIFNGIALAGSFLFIVPFAELILAIPCFRGLVHEVPAPQPKRSKKGNIIFWCTFAFCALVACFIYCPMTKVQDAILKLKIWQNADGKYWIFSCDRTNVVMLWAVFNGLLGIFLTWLTYRFHGKKEGVTIEQWGLKTTVKEFFQYLAVALIVVTAYYVIDAVIYSLFNIDFRFGLLSARPLTKRMGLVTLSYLPFFFIFYFSNSLRVNSGMRVEGQKEWVSVLIAVLGNSVGLILIFVIQYVSFFSTGIVFWTTEWLYVNVLLIVLPVMIILPIFNRAFFYKTGKIYLGPMVTCMIFICMAVGNAATSTFIL